MLFDDTLVAALLRGFVLAVVALVYVIGLTRLVGLRSFSKMTSFDFVMTVAMGSLLAGASQAGDWIALVQPLTAMAGLFAAQYTAARMRRASDAFDRVTQNKPTILMRNGAIIEDALIETRVARDDLIAKLREANVTDFSEVRAVVLETTGDISVLHGPALDDDMLSGTATAADDARA